MLGLLATAAVPASCLAARPLTTGFTDDVFYSHPPYPHEPSGAPRHEVRGRADLEKLFHQRGKRSSIHQVDTAALVGSECFAAGSVCVSAEALRK